MIINSSLSHIKPKRTDIKYINIPLNELAQKLTQPAFVNVMALGAFIEKTGILKLESIKEVMKEMAKTVSAKKAALLPNNLECVEFGANLIRNQPCTNCSCYSDKRQRTQFHSGNFQRVVFCLAQILNHPVFCAKSYNINKYISNRKKPDCFVV